MSRRRFRYVAAAGRLIEIIDLPEPQKTAAVMGDLPAYESPIDGRPIEGRAARREDLKRNQCRPYDSGEVQAMQAARASEDRQIESRVNETVERFWAGKSGDERAQLARALESGADVRMMRK